MTCNRLLHPFVLASLTLAIALPAFAQDPGPGRRPNPDDDRPATETEDKGEEEENEAKSDETDEPGPILAIVGADIETVTQGTIRRGMILIQDGKIKAVGQDLDVPEEAEVIDAAGKIVTPGFIALEMSNVGVGYAAGSRENKVADALDPFDRNMKYCLGVGITTGATQVGGSSRRRFFFDPAPGTGDAPVEVTYEGLLDLHAAGAIDDDTMDHLLGHLDHSHSHNGEPLGLFAGGDGPGMTSPFDDRFFGEQARSLSCEHCAAVAVEILPEPLAPPQPAKPQPNDHVVIKLTYGDLDGMLVSERPFYSLSSSGLTGPFNVFSWRENIKKARNYLEEKAQYDADKDAGKKDIKKPRKPVDDGLLELVQGEIPLRIDADRADDILDQIALAKELDYDLVIDGATETWVVAEQLGEARVPVILTPRNRRRPQPGKEDSTGSSIETPGILQAAGVPFAITTLGSSVSMMGLAGRDLTSLPLEAAFAVRGGADEATALAALTIVPARILGLEDRIGSIEEGKDADVLILNGPPLDYRTYVEQAIVDGKIRYDRAEDRVYPVFDHDAASE